MYWKTATSYKVIWKTYTTPWNANIPNASGDKKFAVNTNEITRNIVNKMLIVAEL